MTKDPRMNTATVHCKLCRSKVRLRANGTMRKHGPPMLSAHECRGSGTRNYLSSVGQFPVAEPDPLASLAQDMKAALPPLPERSRRQAYVLSWVVDTFGHTVIEPRERAARVLEEALELAQAAGMRKEAAMLLLGHVYGKPPGEVRQEAGGVGVTLLAFCAASEFDADVAERVEFERASSQPREKMRARHQAKVDQGIAAKMSELPQPQCPSCGDDPDVDCICKQR